MKQKMLNSAIETDLPLVYRHPVGGREPLVAPDVLDAVSQVAESFR